MPLTTYKGLEIYDGSPTGDGGQALNDNFTEIADRIGPSNQTATVAPTVNDDGDDGYEVGSVWSDVTADKGYVCLDNTVDAAVWLLSTAHLAADIEDFDAEVANNAAVAANTTHRSSDGSDHGFIDQDVSNGASPTFNIITASGLTLGFTEGRVVFIGAGGELATEPGFDYNAATNQLEVSILEAGQVKVDNLTIDGFSIVSDEDKVSFSDQQILLGYIDFDLSVTPGAIEGRLAWNDDDKTLNLGMAGGVVNLQLGQEMLIRAKNDEGSQIDNGEVVFISGGTGAQPEVQLADASTHAEALATIAVATEDVASPQFGYFTTAGLVRGLNTNAWAAGTLLYLATSAGGLTSTRPTAPDSAVCVATVVRQHASEGVIYVRIHPNPNLEELSDVSVSGVADRDILQWIDANSRWENISNPVFNSITIGLGAAGVDYQILFDGETSDGLLAWMEDEASLNVRTGGAPFFDFPGFTSGLLVNDRITASNQFRDGFGCWLTATANQSGGFLQAFFGGYQDSGGSAVSVGTAIAAAGFNNLAGTNARTFGALYAGFFESSVPSGGTNVTINTAYGVFSMPVRAHFTAAPIVGTSYSGYFSQPSAGVGSLTNNYVVFLEDATRGSSINWSLYSLGDMTIHKDAKAFSYGAGDDARIGYSGVYMFMNPAVVGTGSLRIGDETTNYSETKNDGSTAQVGTARIDWAKKTAATVTLGAGSSAETVADLQTAHDGNFYHITEAAATPGIDLIVDFTSITAFNWVNAIAQYDGGATHAVGIQLYNWNSTTWDTFDATQNGQEDVTNAGEYILCDHSFFVPSDTNYVGTGGDAGKVRVRFHHTMAGNASHDLYIDVVGLYQ